MASKNSRLKRPICIHQQRSDPAKGALFRKHRGRSKRGRGRKG